MSGRGLEPALRIAALSQRRGSFRAEAARFRSAREASGPKRRAYVAPWKRKRHRLRASVTGLVSESALMRRPSGARPSESPSSVAGDAPAAAASESESDSEIADSERSSRPAPGRTQSREPRAAGRGPPASSSGRAVGREGKLPHGPLERRRRRGAGAFCPVAPATAKLSESSKRSPSLCTGLRVCETVRSCCGGAFDALQRFRRNFEGVAAERGRGRLRRQAAGPLPAARIARLALSLRRPRGVCHDRVTTWRP